MLDDLRDQAESSYDEEEDIIEEEETPSYFRMRYDTDTPFLGMTPAQRFIIAMLLLLMTFVVGASIMLVTETVIPPL